ncbi:hypothetical protein PMAYCL1PPCAC_01388, partial [Pristionchus mayeri]
MAFNRLSVFVYTPFSPLFSQEHVGKANIICWILVIFITICSKVTELEHTFNRRTLEYEDSGEERIIDAPYFESITILDNVIPFIVALLYIVINIAIRKKRSNSSTSSSVRTRPPEDRKLLLQAIIITGFLEVYFCLK